MTWRRSAVSRGRGPAGAANTGFALLDVLEIGDGAKQFAAMSERRNADLFQVLIRQIT